MTIDTKTLVARVVELEERVARYRKVVNLVSAGFVLVILLAIGLFLQVNKATGRVEALKTAFYDSGLPLGHIRAKTISATDEQGRTMVLLSGVELQNAGLVRTYNERQKPLTQLGHTEGNLGNISVFNGAGKELLALGATEGNSGSIITYDSSGRELVSIGADERKLGTIITFNDKEQSAVELGVTPEGAGSLVVRNRFGNAVCTMDETDEGDGIVGAWDHKGRGRATLQPDPD